MDIRYYYIKNGGGMITACTNRNLEKREVTIGFAWCSPKDQFKKEMGRKISLGRLIKRPYEYQITDCENSSVAVAKALSIMVDNEIARKIFKVPYWVDASEILV